MMKRVVFLASILFAVLLGPSLAQTGPGTTLVVPSIAQLRLTPATLYRSVYVTQYSAVTGIGGGEFSYTGSSTCSDNAGTLIQSIGGCYRRIANGQPYSVAWFGAQCGGVQVTDGVSTSTSHTITSASNLWTSAMVGWVAVVNKAASSSHQLVTTVSGFTNAGSITLTAAAAASGTAETISLYPDDTTALDATWTAAGAAGVAVTLPAGLVCGYANPGSGVVKSVTARGLYLNGGKLWLGQTGAVTDTGVGWEFQKDNSQLIGPGVVDGLYQTNQGIAQFNTTAIGFNTSSGAGAFNVTIQNTKGRAINTGVVSNFTLSNVLAQNCGDYSYQHSSTPGDMDGRPGCTQIANATGAVNISNYTALNAAQYGLLLNSTDTNVLFSVSNCYFSGNGYYGLDAEDIAGSLNVNGCQNTGNGVAPSGAIVSGGYIMRAIPFIQMHGIRSYNTDADAFSASSTGSDAKAVDWSFVGMDIYGTVANHAAQLSVSVQTDGGNPQRISFDNVNYDTATFAFAGDTCSTSNPRVQLLSLHNFNATQLYSGAATILQPNGGSGEWTYVLASDSNFGATTYATTPGTANDTYGLDFFQVLIDGSVTVTSGTPHYIAPVLTNPLISFTCP